MPGQSWGGGLARVRGGAAGCWACKTPREGMVWEPGESEGAAGSSDWKADTNMYGATRGERKQTGRGASRLHS